MAATASYSAVPSILMVAPTGRTKRAICRSTWQFSNKHFMVMGSVAELRREETTVKYNIETEQTPWPASYTQNCPGLWPGGGRQGNHHGLQQPTDEGKGVLPCKDEIEKRQEDESMDKEASKYGDTIPAQLLAQCARVLHVQDLPCHQEDDSKRKVPDAKEQRASWWHHVRVGFEPQIFPSNQCLAHCFIFNADASEVRTYWELRRDFLFQQSKSRALFNRK